MKYEMQILRTLFAAVLLTTALVFGAMLIPQGGGMRLAYTPAPAISLAVQPS
ncbi:MAG TPA: hypothetical protein VFJ04_00935 [Rhodanobacteraceae bacterium]|jgi:hypothetical protein|nr:hypothetical protein [Rhodanobacteraceae bacterium]